METSYNARCPAVKRLLKEAQELHEATEEYFAQPLEDNLFEWHFTVRGPPETEFDGGIYHGRIIMPPEYPMKPPNIIFYTPNGRFETNKKICLSISGHHPETWQPSWSIRTALLAIIGFMPTPANGTLGSLDYTPEERKKLASKSVEFTCCECGKVTNLLKERTGNNADIQREAREVSSQMNVAAKANEHSKENEASIEEANLRDNITQENIVSDPLSIAPETASSREQIQESVRPISQHVSRQASSTFSISLLANNILISASAFVLIALVLRRLFLLESEVTEDVDDILI